MHCVWQTSFNFLALLGDVTFSTALLNKRCFFGEKSSYFPKYDSAFLKAAMLQGETIARFNQWELE